MISHGARSPVYRMLCLLACLLLAPAVFAAPCDSFYPTSFQLAAGQLNPAMASLAKPAKGVVVSEPNFGTCLLRATSHATEPPNNWARNDYSRRQAFNANSTYYIIYSNGSWHLYSGETLAHVRVLTTMGGDAEPQWHPTNPNLLYYLPTNGGTKLLQVDVRNNASSTAVDFVGKLPAWGASANHIWTRSEGSPSADGRYWGFLVYNSNWNMLGHIVWDLQLNQLAGSRASNEPQDNASMSASGRWFVVSGSDGTWAWSRDFASKKKIDSYGVHSDLALSPTGQDYYVSVDFESSGGDVYYVNLDACPSVPGSATSAPVCPRTVLFSMYPTGGWSSIHFSGKAFAKPGWVLMSTYDAQTNGSALPWFTNKVMAVELKESPRIHVLAYTRRVRVTSGDTDGAGNYWAEPHASVNRDFTRMLFNSNWGNSVGADIDTYMIQLPNWVLTAPIQIGPRGGTTPTAQVPGNEIAAPVADGASVAAAPASTFSAPAATQTSTLTYSIGCPACVRLAKARTMMATFAQFVWNRARPRLALAMQSLNFSRDEPAPRARTVKSRTARVGAVSTQALTAVADTCRRDRGIGRIERDSRETAASYGDCRSR